MQSNKIPRTGDHYISQCLWIEALVLKKLKDNKETKILDTGDTESGVWIVALIPKESGRKRRRKRVKIQLHKHFQNVNTISTVYSFSMTKITNFGYLFYCFQKNPKL